MKRITILSVLALFVSQASFSQELDPNEWPPTTDFSDEVHFWDADGFLFDAIPAGQGNLFFDSLNPLSGGDHNTEDVVIGGELAKRALGAYFNVADELFFVLPEWPVIDILVLYYANSESRRDNVAFLLGQLGNLQTQGGYSFESVSDEYEWRLFRVDNSGGWAGDQIDSSVSGSEFGGVNGGTIRFQQVSNVIFRAVAFGPEGAFGEPEDINVAREVDFDPDDHNIVAEWDIHNGVTEGLDVYRVDGGDQEIIVSENVGPDDDQRTAIRPAFDDGQDDVRDIYVNWEILDEWFGPTDQPSVRMKVVAEYYDDPAHAGAVFGPEAYTTAGQEITFFPADRRTVLQGSGQWREAEWYVTDVKFYGVNVTGQAGPRFTFEAPVYISRLRMGVLRTSGMYEGVDPIPDSYPFDPDPYEIYAELDLDQDVQLGLDMGSSGGDQRWFLHENIGPAGDQRTAVRPALSEGDGSPSPYMNFAILDEWFGPSNQPNATLKIAVDYYDDPQMAGEIFGPEVYQTSVFGNLQFAFYPLGQRQTLEGSGEWRTAVWVVEGVNFTGVNVGPQGAVRLWFSENGAIYISRVRYAVIRPVGIHAGVDMLADLEPTTSVDTWMLH